MQSRKSSTPNRHAAARMHGRQAQPAARGRDVIARRRSWRWAMPIALVLLVGGVLAVTLLRGEQLNGKLIAEQTTHDFGAIPIHGGVVYARFPLSVQGATLVTDLGTS